jgi:transcriptional regulator with XRE-family HTH domain
MVKIDFPDWLRQQLDQRGWDQIELAYRSGVTPGQVSRILSGTRHAGPETCIALARALNLPREEVFQARGWLLAAPEQQFSPEMDPRVVQLAHEVNALPFDQREAILDTMQSVLTVVDKVAKQEAHIHKS